MKRSWEIIREVYTNNIANVHHQSGGNTDSVKWKQQDDPVTIADMQAQYVIYFGLKHAFPGLHIIGEEQPETMIKTDADFEWGSKIDIKNSEFANLEYNVEDCTVWIDPLDGTAAYVEGLVSEVTIIVGLAHKGVPKIGLISTLFSDGDAKGVDWKTANSSVYVGDTSVPKVFVYESTSEYDKHNLVRTILPFSDYEHGSKELRLAVSGRHYSEKVQELIKLVENGRGVCVSGCGFRYALMCNREIEGYIQNFPGACKWDTISGEALLECLGGISTAVEGSRYNYGNDAEHINGKGQFALDSKKNHEVYCERIRK